MQPEDFDKLHSVPLFQDLTEATLRELVKAAFLQRFPVQTILFRQGDLPDFLHILLEGSVQLTATSPERREAVVDILDSIEAFMPAAVLTGTPYLVTAKVVHPARILMLPARALRESVARDGSLSLAMIASLSRQYRTMLKQIKDLKLRTSTQRLGCYLMALAVQNGTDGTVDLPHDKRLIAARLGMTPESLSRAFSALRKFGVEVRGHTIRINDAVRLNQFCMPDELIDSPEPELKIVAA
ncbi:MAG TPA: cyclic nucleotide-binding domain-containing protein [Alphaproteobacteria bacterium]|nr:cyclic nucleotide-binding domain-containing protein [Alphaproteobacteria bacterium]